MPAQSVDDSSVPPKGSLANKRWRLLFVLALILVGLGAAAVSQLWSGDWVAPPEATAMQNPVPATSGELKNSAAVYADHCARCHGDMGRGDGPDASMYRTRPTDFSDGQAMGQQTDGELFWKLSEGRRPMPAFRKQLTDEQRWGLVNLVRSFSGAAKLPAAGPQK